jgi:hypothetical protein
MKAILAAAAIAVFLSTSSARAESMGSAISNFGLVGVWSSDCGFALTAPCHPKVGNSAMIVCASREIFKAPWVGAPTRTIMNGSPNGHPVISQQETIDSATRVSGDELRITYKIQYRGPANYTHLAWVATNGDEWQVVYRKINSQLQIITSQSADGKKLAVVNGYYVMPAWQPGEDRIHAVPQQWQNTYRHASTLDRCLDN